MKNSHTFSIALMLTMAVRTVDDKSTPLEECTHLAVLGEEHFYAANHTGLPQPRTVPTDLCQGQPSRLVSQGLPCPVMVLRAAVSQASPANTYLAGIQGGKRVRGFFTSPHTSQVRSSPVFLGGLNVQPEHHRVFHKEIKDLDLFEIL